MTNSPAADSGRDGIIIDAHQHIGGVYPQDLDQAWVDEDMRQREARMAAMGVDRCVLLPAPITAAGLGNEVHGRVNDGVARTRTAYGRLVAGAGCTVNPVDAGGAAAELERALTTLNLDVVVFHHRYLGMQASDRRMDDLVRIATEHGKTIFVHVIADSTFEAPWRLFSMAARFPDARFLALDGFSRAAQSMMIRDRAPDFPNIWFDTGAMTAVAHGVEEFLEVACLSRLVLGTDLYSGKPHFRVAFPVVELRAMRLARAGSAGHLRREHPFLAGPAVSDARVLVGQAAIVTGAGRGIGAAIASVLAGAGAAVLVAEIDPGTAERTSREIAGQGGRAQWIRCDVTREADVRAAVQTAAAEFGRLDILVNNAQAVRPMKPLEMHSDNDVSVIWDSGLWGTFRFMRAAFPLLRESRGKVVNLGSPAGVRGYPGWAAYAAAKEGIRGLTKAAANDWGQFGIRVNVICPSAASPGYQAWAAANPENYQQVLARRALKRDGDAAADIAAAVLFLVGPGSGFVTGHTLMVEGGAAMLPLRRTASADL